MAIKAISLSPWFLVICPDNRGVCILSEVFPILFAIAMQFAVMWLPTAVSMSVHC